jgi:hypothetical protein
MKEHQATESLQRDQRGLAKVTRALLLLAAPLLLLPLIAGQFTAEVDWTANDYVAAALLMGIAIALIELVARIAPRPHVKLLGYGAIAGAFLLVWAELAVGIFGT